MFDIFPSIKKLLYIMYTLELGDGWAPGILETEQEYDFVEVVQRGLTDSRSYWIGGSTAESLGTIIPFSAYGNKESY